MAQYYKISNQIKELNNKKIIKDMYMLQIKTAAKSLARSFLYVFV